MLDAALIYYLKMDSRQDQAALDLVLPRLRTFLASADAILDVRNFVIENEQELSSIERAFVREATVLYPGIPVEVHKKVAEYVHPKIHERMDQLKLLGEDAAIERQDEVNAVWQEGMRTGFLELTGNHEDYGRYAPVWNRTSRSPHRGGLLRDSLLISTVSSFEVLVSGLVRAFLELKPDILRASEQQYTYADMSVFSTMEEFREYCREKLADGLLRGGFTDWMEWFEKRQKLSVAGVTNNCPNLIEIFQRRHLLVHNGGVVNSSYLAKVGNKAEGLAVGERLKVSSRYLKNAVEELVLAGIKLAISLVRKLTTTADGLNHISHELGHISYEFLAAGSWGIVANLDSWRIDFAEDEAARLICNVNRWIAEKKLYGFDHIREEVQEWDTSTLSGQYRVAKLTLLEKSEEAYDLVKSLVAGNEISKESWRDWPLLEDVRSYERENVNEADWIMKVAFQAGHSDA